jgi:uncharacterized protein YndB with AHSA1/START domain
MHEPAADGVLEVTEGTARVRFRRRLRHAPETVWRALIEPGQLAAWFPSTIEGERIEGASLRFVLPFEEAPVMEGTLLELDPPRLLAFTWGGDLLRFTLTADDGGCLLELTATLDELGKAARDGAGWHTCLDRLGALLDGGEPPENRWREVVPSYRARFGPEASTLAPPDWALTD